MDLWDRVPWLPRDGVEPHSEPTREYNCIGWAMGEQDRWWDPDAELIPYAYWPPGVPPRGDAGGWIAAFRSQGFEVCYDVSLEPGFERIAVYFQGGTPGHVARQLESGRWTSKIGAHDDIEHELNSLTAGYGEPRLFMKRPRAGG